MSCFSSAMSSRSVATIIYPASRTPLRTCAEPSWRKRPEFCEQVLTPLNPVGDIEGCTRHADGSVATPKGFMQAFRQYADGGWMGISAPVEFGGQGLPEILTVVVNEMMTSANMAFSMYAGLTQGALAALIVHSTPNRRRRTCP